MNCYLDFRPNKNLFSVIIKQGETAAWVPPITNVINIYSATCGTSYIHRNYEQSTRLSVKSVKQILLHLIF
jgi:hypothetical protein